MNIPAHAAAAPHSLRTALATSTLHLFLSNPSTMFASSVILAAALLGGAAAGRSCCGEPATPPHAGRAARRVRRGGGHICLQVLIL